MVPDPWYPRDTDECQRRLSIETGSKVRAIRTHIADLERRLAEAESALDAADVVSAKTLRLMAARAEQAERERDARPTMADMGAMEGAYREKLGEARAALKLHEEGSMGAAKLLAQMQDSLDEARADCVTAADHIKLMGRQLTEVMRERDEAVAGAKDLGAVNDHLCERLDEARAEGKKDYDGMREFQATLIKRDQESREARTEVERLRGELDEANADGCLVVDWSEHLEGKHRELLAQRDRAVGCVREARDRCTAFQRRTRDYEARYIDGFTDAQLTFDGMRRRLAALLEEMK